MLYRGDSAQGSLVRTSRPARRTLPDSSARIRAGSSITAPCGNNQYLEPLFEQKKFNYSSSINDVHSILHLLKLFVRENASCLRGERTVEGDDIRLSKELIGRDKSSPQGLFL